MTPAVQSVFEQVSDTPKTKWQIAEELGKSEKTVAKHLMTLELEKKIVWVSRTHKGGFHWVRK